MPYPYPPVHKPLGSQRAYIRSSPPPRHVYLIPIDFQSRTSEFGALVDCVGSLALPFLDLRHFARVGPPLASGPSNRASLVTLIITLAIHEQWRTVQAGCGHRVEYPVDPCDSRPFPDRKSRKYSGAQHPFANTSLNDSSVYGIRGGDPSDCTDHPVFEAVGNVTQLRAAEGPVYPIFISAFVKIASLPELFGVEEYRVIEAFKTGKITKPIVAWAIGTCAKMFPTDVQFGHAGSMADSEMETADAKNKARRAAGFVVPERFEELPNAIQETYQALIKKGVVVEKEIRSSPWTTRGRRNSASSASRLHSSRRARPGAPLCGHAHLRRLQGGHRPWWCRQFAVVQAPAMNTIVASRARKDLISSLASGLLTIGSRFGGALDEAASMFSQARDTGLTPREFVGKSCKVNKLISGIVHKIKSANNPDLRVELVKEYVRKNFPSHSLLDYALAVEKVTTSKKETLILNIDGCIAVCFVDLLRDSGAFTPEEADMYIKKRLRTLLYSHPADDIFINMADVSQPRVLGRMQ
ncbi:citrate synthase-like protein [Mycena latifolia]|nr:citrate synthase-like protein [Mycena latifolia]